MPQMLPVHFGMFQQMLKWIEMGILPIDAVGGESQSKWYKQNKAAAYSTYFCNNWSITPTLCPVPEGDAAPNILGIIPDKEKYPQAYMIRDRKAARSSSEILFTKSFFISLNLFKCYDVCGQLWCNLYYLDDGLVIYITHSYPREQRTAQNK